MIKIDQLDADLHAQRNHHDYSNKRCIELEELVNRYKNDINDASNKLARYEAAASSSGIIDQL